MIWHKKLKKPLTTVDERLSKLSDDYEKARFTLGVQYMSAVLDSDTDTQREIQSSIADLRSAFDEQVEEILEGAE